MALNTKDLVTLAIATANATPSSPVAYSFGEDKFSYNELNDLLRNELNELAGTYSLYRQNKNTLFELMEQVFDAVLPRKVMEQYGEFAEIKTFAQGDKPIFTQKTTAAAKRRAKRFVTRVGLAGIYEVFKLDGAKLEIVTSAFGGAAQIGLEEFLDGRVQMSDVLDIVMEGLDEQVYYEIEKALTAAVDNMPEANLAVSTQFDETFMDTLVSVADSYGQSVIYCTYEFAAKMIPSDGWVSDAMKDQKWNNGYLGNYKGHRVVVLNQSYTDETNAEKVIDPSCAWIIPVGAEKPVKIAFEGQTIVDEFNNYDRSKEIQIYKKFGVGVITTNNICRYQITSLTKETWTTEHLPVEEVPGEEEVPGGDVIEP